MGNLLNERYWLLFAHFQLHFLVDLSTLSPAIALSSHYDLCFCPDRAETTIDYPTQNQTILPSQT
jgi:hypothetical protein